MADWYSKPSSTPSPSVSSLHPSVRIRRSRSSESRSPSSSGVALLTTPSPLQSPVGAAVGGAERTARIFGDLFSVVYFFPAFLARTRRRNRVGTCCPALVRSKSPTVGGTVITSIFLVEMSAFANTARAWSRLNSTVVFLRPWMKFRPRMVSFSPTATSSGATLVTTGALLASAAEGAIVATSAVTSRAAQAAIMAVRRGKGWVRARSSIAACIGERARRLEPDTAAMGCLPHRLLADRAGDIPARIGEEDELADVRDRRLLHRDLAAVLDHGGRHRVDVVGLEPDLCALRQRLVPLLHVPAGGGAGGASGRVAFIKTSR